MTIPELDLQIKSYTQKGFDRLRKKAIRCCGTCMHKHGTYKRSITVYWEVVELLVPRFRCKICGRTCSILPSFLRAYSIIPKTIVELIRKQYHRYGQSIRSLAVRFLLARSTVQRFVRC